MAIFLQFLVGLIFGLGLLLSGMSNPAKVLDFLDLGGIASGGWDPSLAFVMAGAVAVTFAGFRWVLARPRPFFPNGFTCRPGVSSIFASSLVPPFLA